MFETNSNESNLELIYLNNDRTPNSLGKISTPFAKSKTALASVDVSDSMPTPPDEPKLLEEVDESVGNFLPELSENPHDTDLCEVDYRPYRDRTFGFVFRLTILVWLVVGSAFSLVLSPLNNHTEVPHSHLPNVYETLAANLATIMGIFVLALIVGSLWFACLQSHPRMTLICTLVFGPTILIIGALKLLIDAVVELDVGTGLLRSESIGVVIFSIFFLTGVSIFLLALWREKRQVSVAVHVMELTCDVLRCNSILFALSVALLVFYCAFVAIWLYFFTTALLAGHDEPVLDSGGKSSTHLFKRVLNSDAYLLATFFLMVFFWTFQVFQKLQHFIVGATVADWYFHRKDPHWRSKESVRIATKLSLTRSFGTVCLAGLLSTILSIAHTLLRIWHSSIDVFGRLINRPVSAVAHSGVGLLPPGSAAITSTAISGATVAVARQSSLLASLGIAGFESVATFVETLNSAAVIFAGISGQSLFSSAHTVSRLVRSNLVGSMLSERLIKMMLLSTILCVSFLAGTISFYAATVPKANTLSPYAYCIGLISGLVSFSVLTFLLFILLATMKATYICYLLDLDNKEINVRRVHQAFGHVY